MLSLSKTNNIKILKEINENEMNKYFSNVNLFFTNPQRLIFICMISNISSSIEDFYVSLNKKNNVFHNNLGAFSKKEIRKIYIYESIYLFLSFINENNTINYDKIEENYLKSFCFTSKEKKIYIKFKKIFKENQSLFDLFIINLISKNIFSTKKENNMEFAYIAFYLKEGFNNFIKDYNSLNQYSYV